MAAINIRGVRWVTGSELGFDNTLIPVSGSGPVIGNIVPWVARGPFKRVSILFEKISGTATSINLQSQVIGPDGVTIIASFSSFLNTVTDDSFGHVNLTGTLLVSNGTVVAAGVPFLSGAPFLQFRVTNNDAVNTMTITLQFMLHVD